MTEERRRQKAEAQARYRKSAKGQATIKAYRKTDASKATNANWYAKSKHKNLAHRLVAIAVQAGKLLRQPCEICAERTVQAHHEDYKKPLEVRWLCPTHHRRIHSS